jgi:hypothetical protein
LEYESPKPQAVSDEDAAIAEFPLGIMPADITIVPVDEMFQGGI